MKLKFAVIIPFVFLFTNSIQAEQIDVGFKEKHIKPRSTLDIKYNLDLKTYPNRYIYCDIKNKVDIRITYNLHKIQKRLIAPQVPDPAIFKANDKIKIANAFLVDPMGLISIYSDNGMREGDVVVSCSYKR